MTPDPADPIDVAYSVDAFLAQRVGGVTRYFTELFDNLDRFGVRLHMPWGIHRSLLAPRSPGLIRLPRRLDSPAALRVAGKLNRLTTHISVRAGRRVFHPTYYSAPIPRTGVPRVVTVFDMAHERLPELFVGDPTSDQKRRWCQSADVILAISESTKEELIDLLGIGPDRIAVTPLAASVPSPVSTSAGWNRPYVLVVGRSWPHKDRATALASVAATRVLAEADVVLFGDDDLSSEDRDLVRRLGLSGRVHAASGPDPLLDALYRGAIALVYPSRYEGFGLPILEAMTRGCPVICSDLAVHREVAGDAALFFPVGEIEAAAHQLDIVASDSSHRQDLIELGRANAARFTWEETARRTADAYRDAVVQH